MKLLGAVLIVKNEAKTIEKTLLSLLAEGIDAVTVVDTGSTDETQAVVLKFYGEQWMKKCDGSFHLAETVFTDYAEARNKALAIAAECNPTVFTFSISADETLHGGAALRKYLESKFDTSEGAFCVMMRSDARQWPFPRILRSGAGWKYTNTAGKRHEQPHGPNGEVEAPLVPGVFVIHQESDPQRKLERLRQADLPDLMREVEDESKPIELRAEAMFQLAETHFVLGHNEPKDQEGNDLLGGRWLSHKFASMALYVRYAELAQVEGGPCFNLQRAMYARTMFCYVAETFGLFEPIELVKRLRAIVAVAPEVPEAHWLLAKNAAKVDPKKAMDLAVKSAKVAKYVLDHPVHGAVDVELEWKSYLLAAACARDIKDKKLQEIFVKQALAAGATEEVVDRLVGP